MKPLDARIEQLEKRLQTLEDQCAIYQILACYGISADGGSSARAADLWTKEGVYDLHDQIMAGQDDIIEELEGAWHQGLILNGCAHVMGMPFIAIDGDGATATSQSRLYRREPDGSYRVLSCSANRWEFIRTAQGWRCTKRTSRKLDGTANARALLAQGVCA